MGGEIGPLKHDDKMLQSCREAGRQRERERERDIYAYTDRYIYIYIYSYIQTESQSAKQTYRQAEADM